MNRIFGPVLIPNKRIYRNPNEAVDEPHYIFFSSETIRKLRKRFHDNGYDNNVDINHDGVIVKGVKLTKSFIIDKENAKNLPNEFQHLPQGTWMVEYQIDNEEMWRQIGDKKLNGFSINGVVGYKLD